MTDQKFFEKHLQSLETYLRRWYKPEFENNLKYVPPVTEPGGESVTFLEPENCESCYEYETFGSCYGNEDYESCSDEEFDKLAECHEEAIVEPAGVPFHPCNSCCYEDFDKFAANLEDDFPSRVKKIAAEKKIKHSELIDLTGIGKSTFYRILSGETEPNKDHCVEIALALRLNYRQANELLESAGYALSRSSLRDMALRYFFVNRVYSIPIINELLDFKGIPLIGNVME